MKSISLFAFLMALSCSSQAQLSYGARITSGLMNFTSPPRLDTKYLETEATLTYDVVPSVSVSGSVFARFLDGQDYWGGQVSTPVRLVLLKDLGFTSYLAPGYRYMSEGLGAPILEGGLRVESLGNVGLGYRFIFNEWVKNGLETETQYFVFVSF